MNSTSTEFVRRLASLTINARERATCAVHSMASHTEAVYSAAADSSDCPLAWRIPLALCSCSWLRGGPLAHLSASLRRPSHTCGLAGARRWNRAGAELAAASWPGIPLDVVRTARQGHAFTHRLLYGLCCSGPVAGFFILGRRAIYLKRSSGTSADATAGAGVAWSFFASFLAVQFASVLVITPHTRRGPLPRKGAPHS